METSEVKLTEAALLIHRLLRLRVTFPTWTRLLCDQGSSGGLKYRINLKLNKRVYTCYCGLFLTYISWHCEQAKVRRDCELLRRSVCRDTVFCSLTQIGSDPHDVSLSVLAAVMEGRRLLKGPHFIMRLNAAQPPESTGSSSCFLAGSRL